MDAPEDRDVKLQKVSGDLLAQFNERLPQLLDVDDEGSARGRRATVDSLIALIDPFQESPQLLDPHLHSYLSQLTSTFLLHLPSPQSTSNPPPPPSDTLNPPFPLHDAISRLLYTLSKIRGPKIISRFLPNEPRHLEPLTSFALGAITDPTRTWELRYVLLLWLSHLCLTPFDLSTISDPDQEAAELPRGLQGVELPSLAKRLLGLGVVYLASPGNRESDAAALLLVRLCLRRDMRALGLLDAVVRWGLGVFKPTSADDEQAESSLFLKTTILRTLAGVLATGDKDSVAVYAPRIFSLTTNLESHTDSPEWSSANVRRLAMKIYRWVAVLSLSGSEEAEDDTVEDIIERLLTSLGDKDTAVRFGASKSLAVISRKLAPGLAGEVLEAVMGIYDEDVFFHPVPGGPPGAREKVLSAVNAEKWHGATLTLATFLRQRAVRSTDVLERVVRGIVEALHFEQRRTTFALGGNVRDAACYAAWSLARSYTTPELLAVGEMGDAGCVQQLLATELIVAGCLDPLGNIRRAASAALQELIGRHPETVSEGIRTVQVVDYNAVALRRRSVVSVAAEASALDQRYWDAVTNGIINGWRGIGASDAEGRKLAGSGLHSLVMLSFPKDRESGLATRGQEVIRKLVHRVRTEGRSDIELWHGGIWALAEVLSGLYSLPPSKTSILTSEETKLLIAPVFEKLSGKEFTSPILRPELASEAAARLIAALSSTLQTLSVADMTIPPTALRLWTAILEACLDRNDETVLSQSSHAVTGLLGVLSTANRKALITSWIARAGGKRRGYILSLGASLPFAPPELDPIIVSTLVAAAGRTGEVEVRVAAIRALGSAVLPREGLRDPGVAKAIVTALDDYEVDSRGDVGSWVRAEAVGAVGENWNGAGWTERGDAEREVVGRLVRMAGERLDRLRGKACVVMVGIATGWECGVESYIDIKSLTSASSSISTPSYFHALLPLLPHPTLGPQFMSGLVTSAGAGSDSLLKTSRSALLSYYARTAQTPAEHVLSFLRVIMPVLTVADGERVVPGMEVVGGVLNMTPVDTGMGMCEAEGRRAEAVAGLNKLFTTLQALHFKSGNPQKLAAAVRAYSGVLVACAALAADGLRTKVLTKLVGMLLHPFPRLREIVAEVLFVHSAFETLPELQGGCEGAKSMWGGDKEKEEAERILVDGDWLGGVKEVRGGVTRLKGFLAAL